MPLSAEMPWPKRTAEIEGRTMAWVEVGEGDPILFLHGNPTSSYLWRNVIPHLAGLGRCIAPDLIGMGDSDKLPGSGPGSYTFVEHRRYLDGLLDHLGLSAGGQSGSSGRVVLVLHDWGSALGFDWANRHREAVAGIAHMESIVRPLKLEEWPEKARPVFLGFRSEAGETMVLERNLFIERVLPGSILRDLSEVELDEYRRPFREPGEGRRPTLTWPRQIPIGGEPADVVAIVAAYARWLSASPLPKLLISAEPGAILCGAQLDFTRSWPNTTEVTVAGSHFVQEDSPDEIGQAVAAWIPTVRPG